MWFAEKLSLTFGNKKIYTGLMGKSSSILSSSSKMYTKINVCN